MRMRERLIELIGKELIDYASWQTEMALQGSYDMPSAEECIADKILADGWMRPPCKVGDMVYEIDKDCLHCEHFKDYWRDDFACEREPEGSLFDLDYDKNCKYSIDEKPFNYPLIGYINKTVFLTREEAEQALVNCESSKSEKQRKEDEGK